MPRPGQPPASTLRNRNRINNKSRLKIKHGNQETDPIIPDEDEEKTRLLQSVAGVDQEDANEHHLQAVLSAAALQNLSTHRSNKAVENEKEPPAAFIPIPDSTGLADDWKELYPTSRWKDPVSYVQFSSTIEECANAALANNFSYYMDERDLEWLNKNNEEARGEGTSVQGAVSSSATRTSSRSAKAKGKEPDSPQAISMTSDEFELSLETGMAFPPFNDYQDTFSLPLSPSTFTSFTLPPWLPSSAQLTRIARVIYPYWKERRLEQGGHRIIPSLNFDEADTLNESYICFRRRDVKAVRKTRASQVTSSDKLARLQAEFAFPIELAKSIHQREQLKRDSARQSRHIWEHRMQFVELRRKYPMLVDKAEEELLVDRDRDRPSKKAELRPGVKIPPKTEIAPQQGGQIIRPRDRITAIHNKVETYLQKHKEVDQHWEDVVDVGYIPPPVSYQSRLFKYITPPDTPKASSPEPNEEKPQAETQSHRRSVRMRYGRGGRVFVDRRAILTDNFEPRRKRPRDGDTKDSMDVEEADDERDRRLKELWRFDSDDGPPYGPNGSEEQDRVLVNDHDSNYMRYVATLLTDPDSSALVHDPTITRIVDGQKQLYLPFRLGHPPPRPYTVNPNQQMISQTGQQLAAAAAASLPVSQQMKMQSSANMNILSQHMRISANGGMRRPSNPNASTTVPIASSASPPKQMPQPTHNGAGGRPAINMPHVDGANSFVKTDATALLPHNTATSPTPSQTQPQTQTVPTRSESMESHSSQPVPQSNSETERSHTPQQPDGAHAPKPPDQQPHQATHPVVNGVPQMNGYSNPPAYVIPPTAQHGSALSTQQFQNLKSVFAASSASPPAPGHQLPYMHHIVGVKGNGQLPNGMNINLKLPPNNRQSIQWAAGSAVPSMNGSPPLQRPASVVNGNHIPPGNGVPSISPSRTPSRMAMDGQVNGQHPHQMSMSPPPIHSPQQQSSSPRVPHTPVMNSNAQGGY